jgi:hypothetical protein
MKRLMDSSVERWNRSVLVSSRDETIDGQFSWGVKPFRIGFKKRRSNSDRSLSLSRFAQRGDLAIVEGMKPSLLVRRENATGAFMACSVWAENWQDGVFNYGECEYEGFNVVSRRRWLQRRFRAAMHRHAPNVLKVGWFEFSTVWTANKIVCEAIKESRLLRRRFSAASSFLTDFNANPFSLEPTIENCNVEINYSGSEQEKSIKITT